MKNLKSIIALLVLTVFSVNVWGGTKTCTVTSTTGTSSPVTINDVSWAYTLSSKNGSPSVTIDNPFSTYGLKFGSSGSNYWGTVKLSTDYFSDKHITSVVVNVLNNGNKSATMTVKQGDITIGSETKTFGQTYTNLTANTNTGKGGTLEITYEVAQASCFHSFTITYEDCTPAGTDLSITSASSVKSGKTITLASTGGNGGTVEWSVTNGTGTASISNGILTAGKVGTVTVKAHQDQNGQICETNAQQVFTITPITFTDYITECSGDPEISVSPDAVEGLGYVYGSAASESTVKTFMVVGSNLLQNVTVTAPTGFEVMQEGGSFADAVELTPTDGLLNKTISVRLSSDKTAGDYNGNVTISSTEIAESKSVALSATVTPAQLATPEVTATPAVHQITLSWEAVSNADSYQLVWNNGAAESVTSPVVKDNLTGGQSYSYSLIAVGTGNYSNSEAAASSAIAGKETYTVNFYVNGTSNPVSIQEGEKVIDHAPTPAAFDDEFQTFVGWTTSAISGIAEDKPTLITDETVTGEADYYAVFAGETLSNTYTWHKEKTLPNGNYLIGGYSSSDYLMKNTLVSSYYIDADNQGGSYSSYEDPEETNIWKLTTTTDGTTIYNEEIAQYVELYQDGSYYDLGFSSDPCYFAITAGDKVFTIKSKKYSSYYLYFDASHSNFAAKNSSSNLYLFKQDVTPNGYITNKTNRVTLHYDANAGEEVIANVPQDARINKNEAFTLPTDKLTRTGYTHLGWNESNTAAEPQTTITPTEDVTVYAVWEVKTTTITLSQTDATTKGTEEVVATWGQPMPEATMPQREHYQFAGYKLNSTLYYKADGTSAKDWDKEEGTATMTAQWTPNKHKVIFTNVLVGGSIKVNNQTSTIDAVDYNSTVTITATPSAHYTLTALTWNDNDILSTRSFTMPDEDVTIAATFTEDPKRTISWSVGGQIVSTTANVYDGTAFATIKANAPAVTDNAAGDCADKFMGWAIAPINTQGGIDKENVQWADEATTSETQNTFYAVFAKASDGGSKSITLSPEVSEIGNGYFSSDFTYDNITFKRSEFGIQSGYLQIKANTSHYFANKEALPGAITNISISQETNTSNVYTSTTSTFSDTYDAQATTRTFSKDYSATDNLRYFKISATSSYSKFNSVTITYSTVSYSNYITQCCQAPEHELAITTTALTVKMGNTLQLSTGETGNGNTIKWESSNTAVATVDQTGLVTPYGTGKATISVSQEANTVKVEDKDVDFCEQYAEVEVEVIANNEFGISFTAAEGGSAVAKINDAITQKATTGTTVTIVATESSSDYIFDGWTVVSGGVTLESTTTNPTTFEMGSADVEITPTFYKKTVDNIAIKNAPSVTSYTTRDKLNVTGLVITANYTKHGSEDITYAGNEDKFSFSPALDANLTAGNQQDVTVTYDGKSTTFKIDVAQYTTPYYSLVTDASQLEAGKKVVFGTKEADKVMGYYVDNANNILGVDATYNEQRTGVEVDDVAYTVSGNATDGWHFADAQGRYIYVPEVSEKNYLYAATDKQDKGTWSVSVDETTHILTMVCTGVGSFDRTLLSYNTNDPGFFSCYKTTQKAVYLYMEAVKPQYVPVTSIELDATALNIMQGKSGSLIATVGPENATQHNVTWSIINDNANGKITVTEAGTVLVDKEAAVGATATVRATTDGTDKDGNHLTAECVITVTELETVDYMLVTSASLLQAGDIIVLGCTANNVVSGLNSNTDYVNGVDATYNSTTKVMSSKYAVEITLGGNATDGWTFTTQEGNYYISGSNLKVGDNTATTWSISIANDGNATIKNGNNQIKCNTQLGRFKIYTSESPIQIYSKRDMRYKRTGLKVGDYGTICVPYAVKTADCTGATFWSIETSSTPGYTNPTSVTIVEEEGDLVAGKPYIFCATETEMAMFLVGNKYEETESVAANGLYGNLTDDNIIINPTVYTPGYFFVLQQKLYECGVNCIVGPNRGWVQADEIVDKSNETPIGAPRRVIGNPNVAPTGIDNLNVDGWVNLQGAHKYFRNGTIIIVKEGQFYNAQGIKIK